MKLIFTTLTLILATTYSGQAAEKTRTLPEYNAAEAKNHIGETARVTDRVGCVLFNRRGGYKVGLGECGAKSNPPFWAVTRSDIIIPGPKLEKLKGVVVTVTGKIDYFPDAAKIEVKSTSQIVPHRH